MRGEIITDSVTVCAALSHTKFFAEIESPNFCVFCQVSWGASAKNFSFSHNVGAICHAQRLADVVIGNQKADTTIAQVEYYTLNVVNGFRVNARERLIQ